MHYVIGDIHANIEQLQALLQEIAPKKEDTLIFLGDYVDCLPHTEETIDLLFALAKKYECIFLKGNHEFVWERYLNHGEIERQDFFFACGGMETLEKYGKDAQQALTENDTATLKKILHRYLDLIALTKDFYIVGDYLALHAGLLPEQYEENNLRFTEANYFIRPPKIPVAKKYLGRYTLVAGHHYLGEEPTFAPGYINIDLGSRRDKYIGAFCVESGAVIRSDGKRFTP